MTEDRSKAVLSSGDKVHVVFRRMFEGDIRRHFVGEIQAVDGECVRAAGYTFIYDVNTNRYLRKPENRVRAFSLSTEINLNVIPAGADLSQVSYQKRDGGLVVTDGADFSLDVNEFGRQE